MLELRLGLCGVYIYKDGYYFDEVGFIDYENRVIVSGLTGIWYDLDSIKNE